MDERSTKSGKSTGTVAADRVSVEEAQGGAELAIALAIGSKCLRLRTKEFGFGKASDSPQRQDTPSFS
jgi:hypothetical protein